MESLLRKISARILAEKAIRQADVDRLRAYSNKHPMWRVVAPVEVSASYDAIMANVAQHQRAA